MSGIRLRSPGRVWIPNSAPRERRRLVAERGKDVRPHDLRHSWVTHLRAAGIDPADLATVAGHTVETATARYTHAPGRFDEHIRSLIG